MVYAFADGRKTVRLETILQMKKDKKASQIIRPSEKDNPDVVKVKNALLEQFGIVLE